MVVTLPTHARATVIDENMWQQTPRKKCQQNYSLLLTHMAMQLPLPNMTRSNRVCACQLDSVTPITKKSSVVFHQLYLVTFFILNSIMHMFI